MEPLHERDRYREELRNIITVGRDRTLNRIYCDALTRGWTPDAYQRRLMKWAAEVAVEQVLEHLRLADLRLIRAEEVKDGQRVMGIVPPPTVKQIGMQLSVDAAEEGRQFGALEGEPVPPANPDQPETDEENDPEAAIDRAPFIHGLLHFLSQQQAARETPQDYEDDEDLEDDFE